VGALRRSAQMSAAARRTHLAQSSSLSSCPWVPQKRQERLLRKCVSIRSQGGSAPPARTVLASAKRAYSFEVTSSPEPGVASAGRDPPAIFMRVGARPSQELLPPRFQVFSWGQSGRVETDP